MNKRRIAIGVAVVGALALALALWKTCGEPGDSGGTPRAGASQTSAERAARPRGAALRALPRAALSGAVRDQAGQPVAGALVCASGSSPDLPASDLRDPSCVSSGVDGRYQLRELLPARYQVQASAGGFQPGRYRAPDEREGSWRSGLVRLEAGEERGDIDIVLEPGGVELAGTVLDIGGGPIEGAWVTARAGQMWRQRGASAMGRSDADGRFQLWVAPGMASVSAEAEGYTSGRADAIAPGQKVEVRLTPESVLAGRVVEAGSGKPVPGASVSVGDTEMSFGWTGGSHTLTDDSGRFRIDRLSPGRYKPEAEAPGRWGQAVESVLLGVGQTVEEVVIEVHPAAGLRGRVVVAETEEPCPSGRISLHDAAADRRDGAGIETDGRVEIDALLPGKYAVDISCEGFAAQDGYPDLVVTAGAAPPEQIWKVQRGGRIVGSVRTAGGEPVARARVSASPVGGNSLRRMFGGWSNDQTGADGRFELSGLAPGRYRVSAEADAHPETQPPLEVTVAVGGEATLELRLDAPGSVEGEVVDESGQPVAGVSVRAEGGERWSWGQGRTLTRDDGRFVIEGVRPGPYRILASRDAWWGGELRAPGAGDDDDHGVKTKVVAGQVARVRLVVEEQTGTIAGRVVDQNGSPITDAFLDAERESESAAAAAGRARRTMRWSWRRDPVLTETDGGFQIDKLTRGRYTVRAYRRGGGEAVAEGIAVGSRVTLTIRPTGSISGTARAAGGEAPDAFLVSVNDSKSGFARQERFFRTGGAFAVRDLPPGGFSVTVSAGAGEGDAEVTLAEGQEVTGLSIEIGSRAIITGRVVALDTGDPLPGFLVQARSRRAGNRMMFSSDDRNLSDSEGRFEIESGESGTVQVMAMSTDFRNSEYAVGRRVVELGAGGKVDIGDIRVPKMQLKPMEKGGDLGYTLKEMSPDTEPGKERLEVAVVKPGGPAASAGLAVGDVIVSVNGKDVTSDALLYWTMSHVAPGTTVELGLERGTTVKVTAGPPG
jgi:protocatechuate 3,4-dioxygenase beta subunit